MIESYKDAAILCNMNSFNKGLLYLYDKLKLYKVVIACYMQGTRPWRFNSMMKVTQEFKEG